MPTDPLESFDYETSLQQCQFFLQRQLDAQKRQASFGQAPLRGPTITISHQAGSGAHELAVLLAGLLQAEEPDTPIPWTVFDRHLIELMLEEHHLPHALAEFIPEDRRSFLRDLMDELIGVVPSARDVVPRITETVIHLADVGNVILVGRGANFITARMPNVFHVRIIASLPRRIERVAKLEGVTKEEAVKLIRTEDQARSRYVKTYFHVGISDDLLYYMVINTDRVPCPEAARLIAAGMRICLPTTPVT